MGLAGDRPALASARGQVPLSEFLCCGQTTGGTRIWGVSHPQGWRVDLIPDNPAEFYGVLLSDPASSVMVLYIPAATTVPGAGTDTGNVDFFLDALVAERAAEFADVREFMRRPLPGVPHGRLWGATWPRGAGRVWESLIVVVTPTNFGMIGAGMPQGYLTMMGVRAASEDWAMGSSVYERLLASTKVKMLDGGGGWQSQPEKSPGDGIGGPAVKAGMVRFCPYHCDWIWVDADRPGWACPRDGTSTEPYEVQCRGRRE